MKNKKLTRAQVEAQKNWDKLNKEWDKLPKFGRSATKTVSKKTLVLDLSPPPGRPTNKELPSLSTAGGNAHKQESSKYTGTNMIGIATLHKSISTPVFSQQDAIDVATMRRN